MDEEDILGLVHNSRQMRRENAEVVQWTLQTVERMICRILIHFEMVLYVQNSLQIGSFPSKRAIGTSSVFLFCVAVSFFYQKWNMIQ